MNIYIDESGSFVSAPTCGSWNVVAAVTVAESDRSAIERSMQRLKGGLPVPLLHEVKLNELDEARYLHFLDDLSKTNAILFATATDAGLNSPERLSRHQSILVSNIRENIPQMRFEGGKQSVALLANQIEMISPQLYAQLVCQVDLLHDVVNRSINYYAQRIPGTLNEFRWRIDQKNTSKTVYEDAFEKIAPALLQTRSFREPCIRVEGFDYRKFSKYEYADGDVPEYLEVEYGLQLELALNVQKLIRGNLRFEDSKCSLGIQVADLLASGLRRCLRGGFVHNDAISEALGRLTLQNQRGKLPVHLVNFAQEVGNVDQMASRVVKAISKRSRAMLAQRTA